MMTELSLNILDVAENSAKAGASLISILVKAEPAKDRLEILIEDNGCGMTEEETAQAADPFFTSRTTRKVGLGIPFFKYAAECTGGTFAISSQKGRGTAVRAVFVLSHIDRMPLGDLSATMRTLITCHPDIDFVYTYGYDGSSFTLDTRQFREILGDIPLSSPEVSSFLWEYLTENKRETDKGAVY